MQNTQTQIDTKIETLTELVKTNKNNSTLDAFLGGLDEDKYNELSEISYEYEQAMLLAQKLPYKTITFYGGANLGSDTEIYKQVYDLAKELGSQNWGVITGGGPGVMAAGLLGVREGGGKAIGFRLRLKNEEPLIYGDIDFMFEHFPPRKYALRQSDVLIYFPGSFGTLDELMENLDLIKTNKMPKKPVYLYSSDYWTGLMQWAEETIIDKWKLGNNDLKKLYKIVNSPEEILTDLSEK
jgi:uncharacterized protein (TIGR00730 family)